MKQLSLKQISDVVDKVNKEIDVILDDTVANIHIEYYSPSSAGGHLISIEWLPRYSLLNNYCDLNFFNNKQKLEKEIKNRLNEELNKLNKLTANIK
jgi:hypothetical protein